MLKQSSPESRILFLQLFTRELIANSKAKIKETGIGEVGGLKEIKVEKPKEIRKEKREVEKIKKPEVIEKPAVEEEIKDELTRPIEEEFLPSILPSHKAMELAMPIKPARQPEQKKPLVRPLTREIAPSPFPTQKFTFPISSPPVRRQPQIMEVDLGRLNVFIRDKTITEIECPGPNKPLLVKRAGQVNLTKISLSQEEINKIIEGFSKRSRIPIIGGIFKAAVGTLTISAVISEYVGGRFIIYKRSPYSLLEAGQRQLPKPQ